MLAELAITIEGRAGITEWGKKVSEVFSQVTPWGHVATAAAAAS